MQLSMVFLNLKGNLKSIQSALVLVLLFASPVTLFAQNNPLKIPDSGVIAEAQEIVRTMKTKLRGPYLHIRWHCADGSLQAPKAFACREHGGGHQYAVYSDERARLSQLGWSVGTIFTDMSWEAFWDADLRHQRMRELALEQYMVDIDDGWILHRAKDYRGRIQIEDEEFAGRTLLLRLLENPVWLEENYLLVRELFRVIPHGANTDLARNIRRSAQDIAEQDSTFESIRVEIHSAPSSKSAQRVRAWLAKRKQDDSAEQQNIVELATLLADQIDELYGNQGRVKRIAEFRKSIAKVAAYSSLKKYLIELQDETQLQTIARYSDLLLNIRQLVLGSLTAEQRLRLLDSVPDIESELRLETIDVLKIYTHSRMDLLLLAKHLTGASFGSGFLSKGEWAGVIDALDSASGKAELSIESYLALTQKLNATGNWAVATVRYNFAEPLIRYSALDSRAASFVDDMLRGSLMLQLAETGRRLGFDAQDSAGVNKSMFSQSAPALMALNPGLARGRLHVLNEQEMQGESHVSRDEIVVLTQTVSELDPVAGVLTMGEGNVLSHVQMLARNFGIPNVTLTPRMAEQLQKYNGKDVILAAGSDGSVMLIEADKMNEQQKLTFAEKKNLDKPTKLFVPPVDLSIQHALPLDKIDKRLSGKNVGPKAANLGELNKLFPGRVSPALALPFGVFANQVNAHDATRWNQLQALYKQLRGGKLSEQELSAALEQLKQSVAQLVVSDEFKKELRSYMREFFGEEGQYGIFIRSDTNAEDLPGFTGAGLYDTIPNVVGFENQMVTIPRVWSSILSARAISWRADLLANPENVFPSVLLMKSVPAEKSGVLVTSDLIHRQPGLTASTAWGVGGAVSGETSETIVMLPNGETQIIAEAKTAWQRQLPLSGGVSWIPAAAGPILTEDEQQQLRELAVDVAKKMENAVDDFGNILPWDIEYGFVNGKLTLFQIRPLVEHSVSKADRFLQISMGTSKSVSKAIRLNELPNLPDVMQQENQP